MTRMKSAVALLTMGTAVVVAGGILSGCAPSTSLAQEPVVVPPTLTAEERDRLSAAALDESWQAVIAEFPLAERPDVARQRYVLPFEWGDTRAECLAGFGIDATVSQDGGVEYAVATAQQEFVAVSNYACEATYPLDPIADIPLNESQLEYTYWYYTERLTPCLEENGVTVVDAPSSTVFTETFYTDMSWSPYGSVPDDADWEALNAACPQAGPALYGSDN